VSLEFEPVEFDLAAEFDRINKLRAAQRVTHPSTDQQVAIWLATFGENEIQAFSYKEFVREHGEAATWSYLVEHIRRWKLQSGVAQSTPQQDSDKEEKSS